MSLRADIHSAIDEVAPPSPMLASQVVAFVVRESRVRRATSSRRSWAFPVRWSASLVAAALVVVLIGAAIIGGRVWRDWNVYQGQQTLNAKVAALEARPLLLPAYGASCPISSLTDVSAHSPDSLMYGDGPVYSVGAGYNSMTTTWGTWTTWSLRVDTTNVSGPILVRARDLQTNEDVVFVRIPFSVVGQAGDGIPTGRVIRNDVLQGQTEQVYPELVLDLSRPYPGTKKGDWPIFKSYLGLPKTAKGGCIGFQVDGATFQEWIVVST
jgi:hypothetical protein